MRLIKALAISLLLLIPATEGFATTSLLKTAQQYSGLGEHTNTRQLKKLIGVNPARTPWCGYFAAAVVRKAGYSVPKNHGLARSWMHYGKRVTSPRPGDIVVIKHGRRYHVGIFSHIKGGRIYLMGGNQSNRAQVSGYPVRKVAAMRRP